MESGFRWYSEFGKAQFAGKMSGGAYSDPSADQPSSANPDTSGRDSTSKPFAASRRSAFASGAPPPRDVAVAEQPRGSGQRLGTAELATERARRLAVEGASDREAGPDDRVRGNEPPRPSVEVDLDPAARPFQQRGDDRQCAVI